MPQERLGASDRCRVVRREVATVVVDLKEIETLDQAGRRVARNHVDLIGCERTVAERQIHHPWRLWKSQPVRFRQSWISIRALDEFVAEAGAPVRRLSGDIVDRPQALRPSVRAANENREGVVEPE